MKLSQVSDDCGKIDIFFLHFLMMASTLLGLSGSYKQFHSLENLIHASHVSIDEMCVVNL
jgi:hypothetical protein